MKRLIFAGLVLTLFSGSGALAQSNGGYVDDVYYNGSQAQKDAKSDAKKQKQQDRQDNAEYYNSSIGANDGYSTNGDARVYNNSYSDGDDSYIDYDDDSYTSRIRRFYYPMYNVGYWGSVYSPFWYDPFFANPYYGWGGWYTPGFSIGMSWGFGPYWNNCWGMNTWYGYGMFNSWYSPYYGGGWGWGGGYGAGYWNGYYAGIYDGGRYSPRNVGNYGPRGSRNGLLSNGAYGRNNGMRRLDNGNMLQPINGRRGSLSNPGQQNGGTRRFDVADRNNNNAVRLSNGEDVRRNNNGLQVDGQRSDMRNRVNGNDAIRLSNSERPVEVNQGSMGTQQPREARRGGFFGNVFRGNSNNNVERSSVPRNDNRMQRNSSPSFEQRSQPSRNYSSPSPAPSRSFSPSPSRSSGSFGGGGGGRMSGGRR